MRRAFPGLLARRVPHSVFHLIKLQSPRRCSEDAIEYLCFLSPETHTFKESDQDPRAEGLWSFSSPDWAPVSTRMPCLCPFQALMVTSTHRHPSPRGPGSVTLSHTTGLSKSSDISLEASTLSSTQAPEPLLEALNPRGTRAGCRPLSPPGGSWPWRGGGGDPCPH